MRGLLSIGFVLFIAAAACGNAAAPTTSTSPPASSTTVAELTTTATTAPPASMTTTPATTSPSTTAMPHTFEGAQLVVGGPDGVFLVEADGTERLLVGGPAITALDDLEGGVVFQQERGSLDGRSTVYRVASGGDAAVATLVTDPDKGLILNGVTRDAATTYIYYTRSEGSSPETARDTLRRYDLATGVVTELSVVGYWESGSFPISFGESLILMNWFNEATHGMLFTDLLGNRVEVAANPSPKDGFFDCSPCPRTGAISSDGSLLVYREFDVAVIVDVATGEEVQRISLDAVNQWTVTSFDITRTHLVVNRAVNEDPLPALLYDLGGAEPMFVELPVAGEAHLTRSPVTVAGPVPAP